MISLISFGALWSIWTMIYLCHTCLLGLGGAVTNLVTEDFQLQNRMPHRLRKQGFSYGQVLIRLWYDLACGISYSSHQRGHISQDLLLTWIIATASSWAASHPAPFVDWHSPGLEFISFQSIRCEVADLKFREVPHEISKWYPGGIEGKLNSDGFTWWVVVWKILVRRRRVTRVTGAIRASLQRDCHDFLLHLAC